MWYVLLMEALCSNATASFSFSLEVYRITVCDNMFSLSIVGCGWLFSVKCRNGQTYRCHSQNLISYTGIDLVSCCRINVGSMASILTLCTVTWKILSNFTRIESSGHFLKLKRKLIYVAGIVISNVILTVCCRLLVMLSPVFTMFDFLENF